MASSSVYGGIQGGLGGKVRKTALRKPHLTPYDRPLTALRPTQMIMNNDNNNSGWLSKIIAPASKLITSGANKIFSSVFRKRLLPPPSPPHASDEDEETDYMHRETAETVVDYAAKVPVDCGASSFSQPSDNNEVAELEDVLKQKTFTRSEIDQLTALMVSRASENVNRTEKGTSELKHSDLQTVHARRHKLSNLPARENVLKHALSGTISTPKVRSKVLPNDAASPAEIAKAYMASRSTELSPQVLCSQNRLRKEDLSTPYNPLSNATYPAVFLTKKDVSDIGTSSNGFMTSRFQGTSASYSRACAPYSRADALTAFKAPETGSSHHNVTENNYYRRQTLKRRNSVLENDIGSVGPIRRIRQKPNFLHPKTLSLPSPGSRQATHVSGMLSDVSEVRSSVEFCSRNPSVLQGLAVDSPLGTNSSRNVPSQSIKMAQKIFEQLDKFSPKRNLRKNAYVSVGNSPTNNPGPESLDSLKLLLGSQDVKKLKGSLDSVHGQIYGTETSSIVEEDGAKKLPILPASLRFQDVVDCRNALSHASSASKAAEHIMPMSIVDRPLKKQASQTSGHECPELDENAPPIEGVLSTSLTEGRQHAESPRMSVAIPDKKMAMENPSEPSTAAQLRILEWESNENNSSVFKTNDRSPSVFLPTSPAKLTLPDATNAPQSTLQSERAAPQNKKSTSITAFRFRSDNLPQFVSTQPAAASGTKVEITVSANTVEAEVNGPDKTKSIPVFCNTFLKSGDSPSAHPLPTGSQINNATLLNGVPSTVPEKTDASTPVLFTNTSTNKSTVPASISSSSSIAGLNFANVKAQPTYASSTSISAPETSSTSPLPGSVTFSFGSGFPLASSTLATSASSTTKKLIDRSNATDKISTPNFFGGSTSLFSPHALTSAMNLGGTTGLSSGSIFGSYPFSSGPTTVSSSLDSSFTTSSVSTSSYSTPSNILGITSQSKPTTIYSASPGSTFSFGPGSSGATTSSSNFIFGATPTTHSSSASNNALFVFGSNSASTPALSSPSFLHNDPMMMEDTMVEDPLQPVTPAFVAPLSAPSGGFGSNAVQIAGNPFQFNSQQSRVAPQSSPFQPSGSFEFNGGSSSSFSLGTVDKSQRRIVRVKKTAKRK